MYSIHDFVRPLDGSILPLGVPGESPSSAGSAENRKRSESPAHGQQSWTKMGQVLEISSKPSLILEVQVWEQLSEKTVLTSMKFVHLLR